jgi:hypothetical protein
MSEAATTTAAAPATTSTSPASTDGGTTAGTTAATSTTAAGTTAATTAPTGEAKPTEGAATEAEGKPGEAKASEGAPEKYAEFTLPEGMKPIPAVIEKFQALAKVRNLSQADAQEIVNLASEMQTATVASQTEAMKTMRTGWAAEAAADPEIGGAKQAEALGLAKKAMTAFCAPGFAELLKTSGLDVHPEMIRAFSRVAKSLSEDNFVPAGGATNGAKSMEESFYPSMQKPH